MKKIIKKINIYQLYTLFFLALCVGVFISFIINSKSFIWLPDGFKQHYLFLENLHQTLRNSTNGISTFSWNLGLGLDVIGQLSYYTLGDPFAYISVLFPISILKYVYTFLCIFRVYCVGLAFIAYCNYHKKGKYATLIGALIYTFSGFVLYSAVRHPFFVNAAIWLPLMFLGIDKILKEDKYKLFTFITAISAISNYYFFYMITILTFIYAIIKYWSEYKKYGIKLFWVKFLKTAICYIIGVLSASVLLLPTIYAFANNSRSIDIGFTYYNFDYYAKMLFMSANTPFWTKVYTSSLVFVILPISILNFKKNKENKTFLMNLLVHFIILLVPFFGSLMNGFSFQSNRWTFGLTFVLSYLVTLNIRKDLIYSPKEFKITKRCLIVYFALWFLLRIWAGLFPGISILLAFIFLIILLSRSLDYSKIKKELYFQYDNDLQSEKSQNIKIKVKVILIIAVCLNILFLSYQIFTRKLYIEEFIGFSNVESRYADLNENLPHFEEAINYIKKNDSSFYRIATNVKESNNESLKYGFNGLNTYLSVGNKYVTLLSRELNILNNAKTNALREFDSRSRITTLLGTKYYVVSKKNSSYVPFGYTLFHEIVDKKDDKNTAQIYINNYNLPIVVFYNNYTLRNDFESLSPTEKEQILLKTAVVDESKNINKFNIAYYENSNTIKNLEKGENSDVPITSREITYKLVDSFNIVNTEIKEIQPKKGKQSIELQINEKDIKNCELYLLITNQKYSKTTEYTITAKYNKIKKYQTIRDKVMSAYYINTPNILFNLGYNEKHSGKIEIIFNTTKGKYSFDEIKLIAVPFNTYPAEIENLKKSEFTVIEHNSDKIAGTINNLENGILQLSTSYSTGWTAYVDGNKTDVINVNSGFVGIPLEKGNHHIEFVYSTPYLDLGIKLSALGIILTLVIFVIDIFRHNARALYKKYTK